MNFLRLNDFLMTVLFENEEIIAIDKPYGINAHTNDSKAHHQEFIQDGLIEIYEKQLGIRLSIVHRLDQTTTGVIIFAKSQEAAKKYAEYFFNREVKKTYVFVTAERSTKKEFFIDKIIIHKAKELEATTDLKFIKKNQNFELWEASPHTGRNHQIRIHAEEAGISILGDSLYQGKEYPFLCLHNRKIEFPNGVVIESRLPKYFEDLEVLKDPMLAKALFEMDRRQRLFKIDKNFHEACRLIHNKNELEDFGYTLDLLGEAMILQWYSDAWEEKDNHRFLYIAEYFKLPIVVRRMNQLKSTENIHVLQLSTQKMDGVLENFKKWIVQENNLKFEIRTDSGLSVGLFTNHRVQRNWIFKNSKNKNVLNIFANTCSLSLAALLGGAQQVTSVEANKNILNWGRNNFELNSADLQNAMFLCRDSLIYLDQCKSKGLKFDLILCEAPSFFRGEKSIFKIEKNIEALLEKCFYCLNQPGDIIFSVSSEELNVVEINQAIKNVQKKLKLANLEINLIQSSLDFELPGKKMLLKSFLLRLNPTLTT